MKTITLGNAALITINNIATDLIGTEQCLTHLEVQRLTNDMMTQNITVEEAVLNWAAKIAA